MDFSLLLIYIQPKLTKKSEKKLKIENENS